MTDLNQQSSKTLSVQEQNAKKHATTCYSITLTSYIVAVIAMFASSILVATYAFTIASTIALIWAYIAKIQAKDSFAESHFRNVIRSFWFCFAWTIFGIFNAVVGVGAGYLIIVGALGWRLYRITKGVITLLKNKSYYLGYR